MVEPYDPLDFPPEACPKLTFFRGPIYFVQGFIPGRPIVEIDIEESGLPSLHTDIDDFVEAVRACSLSSAAVKKLRITSFRARASVNATVLINAIGACFPALLSSDLLVNDDHPDTDINSVMH